MSDHALLLSVHKRFADGIFSGEKTVELRRVRPRLHEGDLVVIYVCTPVKALWGIARADGVLCASPASLWSKVQDKAGVTRKEFDEYYRGADKAFAIQLCQVVPFGTPISLEELRAKWPGFRPPQSYWYVSSSLLRRRKLLPKDLASIAPR